MIDECDERLGAALETDLAGSGDDAEDRPRRGNRRRRILLGVLATLVVLTVPAVSFVDALRAPGNTSTGERAVEWLRDHGAGGIVNQVEHWWFSSHPPTVGGEPDHAITFETPSTSPATASPGTAAPVATTPHPPDVATPASQPVAGEGVWHPVGQLVKGVPAMYAAQVRPDSTHTSLLSGLLWMDPKLVTFAVHPGTQEPGGSWTTPSRVSADERLALQAAFNGGFRLKDSNGGVFLDGKTRGTLRDGAASFVVNSDGTATVGQWGRDVTMAPDTVAVRQNLQLIVDGGQPAPGLDDNADGKWGATLGNKVLVWRSAVCVDANGGIIYGYGDGLGARSLADLMQRAGCQRAMELDINSSWVAANLYAPSTPGDPGSVTGTPVLPNQNKSGSRYLSNDSRDFIAVESRGAAS